MAMSDQNLDQMIAAAHRANAHDFITRLPERLRHA